MEKYKSDLYKISQELLTTLHNRCKPLNTEEKPILKLGVFGRYDIAYLPIIVQNIDSIYSVQNELVKSKAILEVEIVPGRLIEKKIDIKKDNSRPYIALSFGNVNYKQFKNSIADRDVKYVFFDVFLEKFSSAYVLMANDFQIIDTILTSLFQKSSCAMITNICFALETEKPKRDISNRSQLTYHHLIKLSNSQSLTETTNNIKRSIQDFINEEISEQNEFKYSISSYYGYWDIQLQLSTNAFPWLVSKLITSIPQYCNNIVDSLTYVTKLNEKIS